MFIMAVIYIMLLVVWAVFGIGGNRAALAAGNLVPFGGFLVEFVLFCIIAYFLFHNMSGFSR
jgi:hypothetical protein